ncbi:hypothetical protein DF029_27050 [Burkholderia cepacia]|nr:hypothetical protein DF029_27050 [Burkholderia cepacia]
MSGGRLHRAVLSCGGTLRTPRYGRDGLVRAVRWNGGVPVAHDIAARRAFYPGRGGLPWNRANRVNRMGGEGGNGNRAIRAARRRCRCAHDWRRARPPR